MHSYLSCGPRSFACFTFCTSPVGRWSTVYAPDDGDFAALGLFGSGARSNRCLRAEGFVNSDVDWYLLKELAV